MEKAKERLEKYVTTLDSGKFDNVMYKDILEYTIECISGMIEMQNVQSKEYTNYQGGFIKLNNRYKLLHISNIKNLTFNRFYPTILNNIVHNYNFNYVDFPKAYKLIYSYIDETRVSQVKEILKKWLNYTYGNLFSAKSIVVDGEINKEISTIARDIIEKIYEKFKYDTIYADTDSIYFKDNIELVDYVDELGYKYSISEVQNIIFIALKKYIMFTDEASVTLRGIRDYENVHLRNMVKDLKNLGF